MTQDYYLGIVEGLLFAVGDEGIGIDQLSEVMSLGSYEVNVIINQLKERYKSNAFGMMITEIAGVFKMTTKKEHADYYKRLLESPHQKTLSPAALEVLAIIAYKQPITRLEVEAIRGVNNDSLVRKLLLLELIEEAGRSKTPGRAMLFKTTDAFLDYFGIKAIDELPDVSIETHLPDEDIRLFK